ncbi:NAD(P)/FAD-dependent oxidoreductase [Mycoplasma tullyi]|uniref:Ferredoxin--NADP reductase n=1 Tax=Mycoplasma tullyi TaxID=1612150 RepID=A0A7D7YMB8_9MOLU|nr:NAD(P)/FAD-dependent oxidoreductase [Mycoplasma tullyi]QMT98802.1 NAD(P)/FAD-dependent oxidoreductase [Mycoplasma tullyi]
MNIYDLIVLGAGTSGIYCASYGAMKGLSSLVVEMTDQIGGQPAHIYPFKKIYDFPTANGVLAKDFIDQLYQQQKPYINQGLIKYLFNTTIREQNYLSDELLFEVKLSNNEVVKAKKIVLATGNGGFEPIKLKEELIQDQDLDRIHYQIKDLKQYENKDLCFLGGGDSAVELIHQVSDLKIAKSLSIIHRKEKYRASQALVDLINKKPINQYLDQTIELIKDNQISFKHNQTGELTKLNFDYLIVQYGLKPLKSLDCFNHLEQDMNNNFVINHHHQTSDKNIYAIGLASNFSKRPNLIISGMYEATVAIKHINDTINPYVRATDYLLKE